MSSKTELLGCVLRRQLNALMPGLVERPSVEQIRTALTGPGQAMEVGEVLVDGKPLKIWKNARPHAAAFVTASREFGDREYIVFNGERLTYEQHYRQVARLANALINLYGIRKGDRVAIAMRNYPEWSVAFWASISVGAIVVPMNAWWTSQELAYGLSDSGARLVFCDDKRLGRIREIEEELPVEHMLVARASSLEASDVVHHMGPLITRGDNTQLPSVLLRPEDEATLFYTSGTTGFPKGTIGTHRNFCSAQLNARYAAIYSILRGGTPLRDVVKMARTQPTMLVPVPLFHVTGCQVMMLSMFSIGGKMVFMNYWEPGAALDLIEQEKITTLAGVPVMTIQITSYPGVEKRNLSSIKNIGSGGAPVPPELLQRINTLIPQASAGNGYGTTETSGAISSIMGRDYLERPKSAGVPAPVYDLRIVDGGRDMPVGEAGEIWVRSPSVVKGYWNKPEATAEAFDDGWYRTGDIGRLDGEGFLYIEDRLKDMIIRGGENIYCAEVEAALSEHPRVKMACVFGVPDEEMGEEVGAVVHVDPDHSLVAEDLRDFVGNSLAAFKVPSNLWFQEVPLPVGATGKVMKKELRAHYIDQLNK